MHRREIESRDALSIARSLTDAFDRICTSVAQ
jgi:hypothetical protein